MCGVAGVFGNNISAGLSDTINFGAMQEAIAPRGPDGFGEFTDEHISLLHTRLAIIDPTAKSSQPFVSANWVLSYNGEIFNYRALRKQLKAEGVSFYTSGDTEVLAHAINHWGVKKTVEEIAGMFAFLAYDKLNHELWVARDRLGIKPLYISIEKDFIAIASWSSAILKGIKKNWKLDRTGLHRFCELGAVYGGGTLVQGIDEFPAAQVWRIDRNLEIIKEEYWELSLTPKEFNQDEFLSLFENVILEHCESDVSSCLLISGGVDSTSLAASIGKGKGFHLNSSELPFAKEAAKHCGFKLNNTDVIEEKSWHESMKKFSMQTGAAFASLKQTYAVSRAISMSGSKMALSANGADELYLGYSRTPTSYISDEILNKLPPFESAPETSFEQQVRHIFISGSNLSSQYTGEKDAFERDADLIQACSQHLQSCIDRVGTHAANRLFELETYVLADLNANLDSASMFWGVEMRVPFLDHRLVEHALSLKGDSLITAKWGRKTPLKEFLSNKRVPESIWNRKKVGFSLNTDNNVFYRDELLDCLTDLMNSEFFHFLPRSGYLYRDYMKILFSAFAFRSWKEAWIDTGIVSL